MTPGCARAGSRRTRTCTRALSRGLRASSSDGPARGGLFPLTLRRARRSGRGRRRSNAVGPCPRRPARSASPIRRRQGLPSQRPWRPSDRAREGCGAPRLRPHRRSTLRPRRRPPPWKPGSSRVVATRLRPRNNPPEERGREPTGSSCRECRAPDAPAPEHEHAFRTAVR